MIIQFPIGSIDPSRSFNHLLYYNSVSSPHHHYEQKHSETHASSWDWMDTWSCLKQQSLAVDHCQPCITVTCSRPGSDTRKWKHGKICNYNNSCLVAPNLDKVSAPQTLNISYFCFTVQRPLLPLPATWSRRHDTPRLRTAWLNSWRPSLGPQVYLSCQIVHLSCFSLKIRSSDASALSATNL